jgi:hypothetical protein
MFQIVRFDVVMAMDTDEQGRTRESETRICKSVVRTVLTFGYEIGAETQ